jgi:hypothetical protein
LDGSISTLRWTIELNLRLLCRTRQLLQDVSVGQNLVGKR